MSFSATTQCTEKTCNVAQRSRYHKAARTGKFCWSGRFRIITASSLPGHAETRRKPLAFLCLELVTMGSKSKARCKACCRSMHACVLKTDTDAGALFRLPVLPTKGCRSASSRACASHSLHLDLTCTKYFSCQEVYSENLNFHEINDLKKWNSSMGMENRGSCSSGNPRDHFREASCTPARVHLIVLELWERLNSKSQWDEEAVF